jgi:hypothetical protein
MRFMTRILVGGTGLAAFATAVPAISQVYVRGGLAMRGRGR